MSWYSRHIFPYLCDWALRSEEVAAQRRIALASARGHVLEIGFGTGLNLPHYPTTIDRLTVVDPNPTMHRLAQRRLRAAAFPIDARQLDGQRLPFEPHAFDTVVSTFTLCSIPDWHRAVREAWRVLRPGGRFLFLEHGLSPDPGVQRWQHRLDRLQTWLGDGCHLNRNFSDVLRQLPGGDLRVENLYLPRVPRTHGFLYRGWVVKPPE